MEVSGTVEVWAYAPHAPHTPQPKKITALVSTDLQDDILVSWHDLVALGVLHPSFPNGGDDLAHQVRTAVAQMDPEAEVQKIKEEFADILSDSLEDVKGTMAGPPMHITIDPNANVTPLKVRTARKTPIHIQAAADALIQELLAAGIIVPVHEATEWISPAHFVPKPGGKARLVTDYRVLNKAVQRPVHPFRAPRELMAQLPAGMNQPEEQRPGRVSCQVSQASPQEV